MNKEASNNITRAYWSVGDYFSRLGGSARYFNMPESDIPLLIGCELALRISQNFNANDYLPRELTIAAEPIIENARTHLNHINANQEEMTILLIEFINHVDAKYHPQHRSHRWEMFMEWARALAPNNSIQPTPASGRG